MKRSARAVWKGSGKTGAGRLTTQSKTLKKTPYSFHSRFEEGKGTNPEELIAAAHAGCFAMKLSFNLSAANFPPQSLRVDGEVSLEDGRITYSRLKLRARVADIPEEKFAELVEDAKLNCPISKLLNTEITVDYTLKPPKPPKSTGDSKPPAD